MSTPHTLDDTLRIHDQAVMDWFAGLLVDYDDLAEGVPRNQVPILAQMATPSRAFATCVDFLVKNGWLNEQATQALRDSAEANWPILPLPIITVERDVPVYDPELVGVPRTQFRKQVDPLTGRWVTHEWPNHYRTTYRATLWCLQKYTEAYVNEWIVSKFSLLGASNREAFIPVKHRAPWGTMYQSWIFDDGINLSDLEGEGQRYIRIEYSFRLRTWYMRPPKDGGYVVNLATPSLAFASRDANGQLVLDDVYLPPAVVSDNLFRNPIIPEAMATGWPRWGASAVAEGDSYPGAGDPFKLPARSIKATVQADTSGVLVAEHLVYRPTTPVDAWAIVSLAFRYLANGPVDVELAHYTDPAVMQSAREFALTPEDAWRRFHRFAIVRRNVAQWALSGTDSAQPTTATFCDVDARQVFDEPAVRVASVIQTVGGGGTTYEWAGLALDSYLLVGVLDPASTGPAQVDAIANIISGLPEESQQVDPSLDAGFAILVQPRGGACRLFVPSALTLAAVYALRYAGPYHGHTP